jgi:hypothetical protein
VRDSTGAKPAPHNTIAAKRQKTDKAKRAADPEAQDKNLTKEALAIKKFEDKEALRSRIEATLTALKCDVCTESSKAPY